MLDLKARLLWNYGRERTVQSGYSRDRRL